jgi:GNAT superfamily N-acetyltransferase
VEIERVGFADIGPVATALADAFVGYEWTAHTVAADDHHARVRRTFEAYLRLLLVPAGTAWMTWDRKAAALWTPPDPDLPSDEDHAELVAIVEEAAGERWAANGLAEAALAPHRPTEPCWVLESLGTAPAARRSRHATALLDDGLTRADADGVPVALETCGDVNVAFYLRFGFEITAATDLDDGPTVFTMVWRP